MCSITVLSIVFFRYKIDDFSFCTHWYYTLNYKTPFCNICKFKKMNSYKSPPWRGVGVGQIKIFIHFFEFLDNNYCAFSSKKLHFKTSNKNQQINGFFYLPTPAPLPKGDLRNLFADFLH